MKRVAVWVLILLLLAVGISLVVAGILLLHSVYSETDNDMWILGYYFGWFVPLVGILCCLGAGLVAAFCRPWRSQQASRQESDRRDGTVIQKSLIGALVGLFAGPPLAFLVATAVSCICMGFVYGPCGTVPGLVLGAVIGAVTGKVMDSRRKK